MADAMTEMSAFWDVCSEKTTVPFLEKLAEYDGLLETMKRAVQLHHTTMSKQQETKRLMSKHAMEVRSSTL